LATAGQALRAGRAVMAVPGPVTSAESAGVHELLRRCPEVHLATRAAEVIDLLGAIGDDPPPQRQPPAGEHR
jgi:DNA processing protein